METPERLAPLNKVLLADASALVHCGQPAVAARLLPPLILNNVATCAAINYELASLAAETASTQLAALRRIKLHWLPTDDADLQRAAAIHTELTGHDQQPLPWPRLVIAAVAERHRATVLHYTTDYDLIAKITGQHTDWVAPDGSLP